MYKFLKRFFDILLAVITIIVLLPLYVPISIILLLTNEHEVFFRQKRIGLNQAPFYVWKFVTMRKDSETTGSGLMTVRNDPRVTNIGKFLRKSKVNEFPQIINVLVGEMSIVGPRPLVASGFNAYPEDLKPIIAASKPGLTGVGSIVFRDEEYYLSNVENPKEFYNNVIQPHKGALEVWYYQHKSLWVDLKIIFLTAWGILFPKNVLYIKWLKGLPSNNLFGPKQP